MTIKTQSAKAKGRNLQNHVKNRILKTFLWLGEGDIESCSMGSSGVDIKMSPAGRNALPVSIECKKTKKTPNRSELKQAKANAYEETIPAVVWCPHGHGLDKSLIIFDFDEFLKWYKKHMDIEKAAEFYE